MKASPPPEEIISPPVGLSDCVYELNPWKENLRDNMTNTELILNMLAEASTKDISQATDPETFDQSKEVARQGGNVAKVARLELEARTGKKVVTGLNAKKVLKEGKG